jgi:CHAD domain-containing protein
LYSIEQKIYSSEKKVFPSQITEILQPEFHTADIHRSKFTDTYFDTFDLSLYRKKMMLVLRSGMIYLFTTSKPHSIADGIGVPAFWWDLPESNLRNYLQPIIRERALTALCTVSGETVRLTIRNGDGKNTATMTVQNRRLTTNTENSISLQSLVTLSPLKGFEDTVGILDNLLDPHYRPISTEKIYKDLLDKTGSLFRITRLAYPPKIEPTWSIGHTIKTVAAHLIDELNEYREGIIDDIDTEFLHDFRVTIRRLRAVIGQSKKVLNLEVYNCIRENIKEIGGRTGSLRDLDVLMMKEKYYLSLSPARLQQGLHRFFSYISEQRKYEHEKLADYLQSGDYADTLKKVIAEYSAPASVMCRNAEISTIDFSKKTIDRQYGKLRKKIDSFSHNKEVIHAIRIDCKKLRYVLELFFQLYSLKAMKPAIKELKGFQSRLGDLHDLHVQQEMLLLALHGMEDSVYKSPEANAAVGGLITILSEKERLLSEEIEAALKEYRRKIGKEKIRTFLS